MENGTSNAEGRDPAAFLSEIIGAPVTVKLNSGVVYKGPLLLSTLKSFSIFLPLSLLVPSALTSIFNTCIVLIFFCQICFFLFFWVPFLFSFFFFFSFTFLAAEAFFYSTIRGPQFCFFFVFFFWPRDRTKMFVLFFFYMKASYIF
jgi:hypothetical protein